MPQGWRLCVIHSVSHCTEVFLRLAGDIIVNLTHAVTNFFYYGSLLKVVSTLTAFKCLPVATKFCSFLASKIPVSNSFCVHKTNLHLNVPAVIKRCYCVWDTRRPSMHHQFPWNLTKVFYLGNCGLKG